MTTAAIHPGIASINPATGQTIRTFSPISDQELEAKLQRAADAYERHRHTPLRERTRMLSRAAEILEREKDFMAQGGKFIFPLPEIEIV